MQVHKDYYEENWEKAWWKLYQPLSFTIANKSGESLIGTKSQLTTLCSQAENYGIKVIVDVVSNHLASGGSDARLHSDVKNYESSIYNSNLIHTDYGSNSADTATDTAHIVRGNLGELPDLKTESTVVQNRVLSLLKEYIDCGIDGFRFDAAKHIETPDDGDYASNYWPTILDGATAYATSKGLEAPYYYGEILGSPGNTRSFSYYTKYMHTVDSELSSNVYQGIRDKNISKACSSSYNGGLKGENVVLWGESHDTYSNDWGETYYGNNIDQKIIDKAYAIVSSRQNAASLYLSRPGSGSQIGSVGSTAYKATKIKAINKFHKLFVGANEAISNDNGCFINVRSNNDGKGAMIVNVSDDSTSKNVSINLPNGTYKNLITNQTVNVSSGSLNATFTDGICVLVGNDISDQSVSLSLSYPNQIKYVDTATITVTTDADTVKYSINGGTATTLSGSSFVLPNSLANGAVNIKVTASKGSAVASETITLIKVSQNVYNKNIIFYGLDTSKYYMVYAWTDSRWSSVGD